MHNRSDQFVLQVWPVGIGSRWCWSFWRLFARSSAFRCVRRKWVSTDYFCLCWLSWFPMGDRCSELAMARCLFVVSGSCRSTHQDDERDVPQVQLLTWAPDTGVPLTQAFRHREYGSIYVRGQVKIVRVSHSSFFDETTGWILIGSRGCVVGHSVILFNKILPPFQNIGICWLLLIMFDHSSYLKNL